MSKTVLAWLAFALVVLGAATIVLAIKYSRDEQVASGASPADFEYRKVPASAGANWLREYRLTDRSGRLVGSKELAGKVHVVNFFFSTCPTTCLRQNKQFEEVYRGYAPKGVQFASITCDPETDTPSTLRAYANRNFPGADGRWWFLTGNLDYIRRVAAEVYLVPLEFQAHTEKFVVLDKWGNLRGAYHWAKPEELTDLRRKLDQLLAESEPPADLPPQPTPAGASDEPQRHADAEDGKENRL